MNDDPYLLCPSCHTTAKLNKAKTEVKCTTCKKKYSIREWFHFKRNSSPFEEAWLDQFFEKVALMKQIDEAMGITVVGAFEDPSIIPKLSPIEFLQSWHKAFLQKLEKLK